MRHLKSGNKLSRTADHRGAMLANLAMAVLDKERVITTVAKAKAVRSVVERLVTFAKKGGLNAIRIAAKTVTDKDILKKLFADIGPSYKTREGGYTRILRLGVRWGDNAETCILELTGRNSGETALKRKKKRKTAQAAPEGAAAEPEQEKPAAEEKAAPAPVEEKKEKPAKAGAEAKSEKPKAAPKKKKAEPKGGDSAKDKNKDKNKK
ncbi:MAG TPA: 50S ribosomal protein L17 [Chitinivibrionales bacterium]|jgi:large subunit ribosomal protein L17|nr:50S ribosomal protein L17 [Chitinivibrionales bacterium]